MPVRLSRRYRFSASHLYRRPEWTEAENIRRFGKCANLPGHGHNYRLTVTVGGGVDAETGFVIDLGVLDGTVQREVLDCLDHHHLNDAIPEFAAGQQLPTSENLALWIAGRLKVALPSGVDLVSVVVAEDEDLAAECLLP